MLNCWCITWPVGFKRLNNNKWSSHFTIIVLTRGASTLAFPAFCRWEHSDYIIDKYTSKHLQHRTECDGREFLDKQKYFHFFFPRKNVYCRPRKDSEAYKYRTNEVMSYSAHCVYVKPVLRPFSVLVFISQLKALVTILNAGNEHCTHATTNLLRRFNIELNTKC